MDDLISELYGVSRMVDSFRRCVTEDDLDLYYMVKDRLIGLIEKIDIENVKNKRVLCQYIDSDASAESL
ncbi:MAG: hypothetical protein JEY79_01135 [Pseudodesulfovibrio sp.]|nr:hypothetical protein [Pseudodesulfovibrio sp.]